MFLNHMNHITVAMIGSTGYTKKSKLREWLKDMSQNSSHMQYHICNQPVIRRNFFVLNHIGTYCPRCLFDNQFYSMFAKRQLRADLWVWWHWSSYRTSRSDNDDSHISAVWIFITCSLIQLRVVWDGMAFPWIYRWTMVALRYPINWSTNRFHQFHTIIPGFVLFLGLAAARRLRLLQMITPPSEC